MDKSYGIIGRLLDGLGNGINLYSWENMQYVLSLLLHALNGFDCKSPLNQKIFWLLFLLEKKGCRTERSGWLLFYSPWTSFTRRVMHLFHQMQPNTLQN